MEKLDFKKITLGLILTVVVLAIWNCYLQNRMCVIENMSSDENNPVSQENLLAIRNLGSLANQLKDVMTIDADKKLVTIKNLDVENRIIAKDKIIASKGIECTGNILVNGHMILKKGDTIKMENVGNKGRWIWNGSDGDMQALVVTAPNKLNKNYEYIIH